MDASNSSSLEWRKSTRSSGNGNCVEFAELPDAVAVRDSKDRGGPILTFSTADWRVFVAAFADER